jgi:hypothetical protein
MLESAQKLRRVSDPLIPSMPEETSTMIESTSDLSAIDAETVGEPTIVPHKFRQERPSIGDWMGTWWAKGKGGERTSNDKDPLLDEPPNGAIVGKAPNRRRTAKSVFGTLGISILNPTVPPLSSTKKPPIVVDELDAISIKSGKSVKSSHTSGAAVGLSSPIQASLAPSPAAPLISTVFDSMVPSHGLSTKASSLSQDPTIVITQGATLRAIANATRVMSSDPSSILSDQGRDTGPLIARLSMELIKNARDEGVIFRERAKERRGAERASEVSDKQGVVGPMSLNPADATASLNRTLAAQTEGLTTMKKTTNTKLRAASIMQVAAPPFTSPLFGSFMNQQRKPSTMNDRLGSNSTESSSSLGAVAAAAAAAATSSTTVAKRKPASSVPLESIIPATSKPPTQYLSRTYTPLTSRDFRFEIPLPQSASRYTIYHGEKNQRPLTDRYGFMYDVSQYDVLLLIRAKECGNTAPACLTGVKIADREEDNSWPDDDDAGEEDGASGGGIAAGKGFIEIVKESCPCNGDGSEFRGIGDSASAMSSSTKSRSSSTSRRRSSVVTSGAVPPSMIASTSSILSVTSDTPRHACANTVRALLNQLTEIHDQQQAAQRKEWDAFVKQRTKVKKLKGGNVVASTSSLAAVSAGGGSAGGGTGGGVGAAAAAILGLGTAGEDDELSHSEGLIGFAQLGLSSNKDERREFDRLIRSGIPLVYRAKVWLESSGALEMREPGIFRDLLEEKDGPDSVRGEIEKDVGRTMPLNIFFGGDGAGVDKLRRVLIAYSRCVVVFRLFFFCNDSLEVFQDETRRLDIVRV